MFRHVLTILILSVSLVLSTSALASAKASVTHIRERSNTGRAFFDCDGVFRVVLGEATFVGHTTVNFNRLQAHTHVNFHGTLTLPSGLTYQLNNVFNLHSSAPLVNGAANFTLNQNIVAVAPGPDNNLLIHSILHLTFNANGELTAFVIEFRQRCQ